MIDNIAVNFANTNFCQTIHDAVICKYSDLNKLTKVLNFHFGLYFDKLPALKVTNLKGELIGEVQTINKIQTVINTDIFI